MKANDLYGAKSSHFAFTMSSVATVLNPKCSKDVDGSVAILDETR